MELVATVAKSADAILEVAFFVDFGGSFSEHFRLHLRIIEAHVVHHMRLHLRSAHAFLGEDFRILSRCPIEHDLCVCECVHVALPVKLVGGLEVLILVVFVVGRLADEVG